jgi:hypothetical protein
LIFFSSESDSTKDVHDKINPKHLNDIERVVTNRSSTNDGDSANSNVNG